MHAHTKTDRHTNSNTIPYVGQFFIISHFMPTRAHTLTHQTPATHSCTHSFILV
eukprot:EC714082.1.p4 GENE.EC714082.1~~EC714082.1.p4  ORF type:complete len:54 (-),score=4.67 EC714082.1:168-329(-)